MHCVPALLEIVPCRRVGLWVSQLRPGRSRQQYGPLDGIWPLARAGNVVMPIGMHIEGFEGLV